MSNLKYMQVLDDLCMECGKPFSSYHICAKCSKCKRCCECGFEPIFSMPKLTTTNNTDIPQWVSSFDINWRSDLTGHFKALLERMSDEYGFELEQEWLDQTPRRLYNMYAELLKGYKQNPKEILAKVFDKGHDSLIALKDIEFVSLCQHHWLPFKGVAHFGYMPKNGKIIGLSKIPRLIYCFSHRFQTQEEMSSQIVDAFMKYINPEGCMIITEAEHLCYSIRGPKTKGITIVIEVRGCFAENSDLKNEFLHMTDK